MFVWLMVGCCLCLQGIFAERSESTNAEVAEMDKTEVSNPLLRAQEQELLAFEKRFPLEMEEAIQEYEKRAAHRNPYSWMNSIDSKRDKRSRNPYAWLSLEENRDLAESQPLSYGWFKTMDKKSRNPYSWMNVPKRARNPYSWMNFI